MLRFKVFGSAIATAALACVITAPAVAQSHAYGGGRPGSRQHVWQIRDLVNDTERSSNAFRDAVERRDRQTDTPHRRGTTNRERFFDDLTPAVQRMDEAFERLRRVADNNRPRYGRDEMAVVLNRARVLDRYFTGERFEWEGRNGRYTYSRSPELEARWRDLRRDINMLARAYDLPVLGGRR